MDYGITELSQVVYEFLSLSKGLKPIGRPMTYTLVELCAPFRTKIHNYYMAQAPARENSAPADQENRQDSIISPLVIETPVAQTMPLPTSANQSTLLVEDEFRFEAQQPHEEVRNPMEEIPEAPKPLAKVNDLWVPTIDDIYNLMETQRPAPEIEPSFMPLIEDVDPVKQDTRRLIALNVINTAVRDKIVSADLSAYECFYIETILWKIPDHLQEFVFRRYLAYRSRRNSVHPVRDRTKKYWQPH